MGDTMTTDIFSLKNDAFYTFVRELVGQQIVDVMTFQSITSTQSLIRNSNIFDAFQLQCSEPSFLAVRSRSCWQLDDGQFVVKIGLVNNLNYLLDFLKQQQRLNPEREDRTTATVTESSESIGKHPLLTRLILWYERTGSGMMPSDHEHGILPDFIDTITENLTRPRNRFRYNDTMKNFALSLYILGGKLTYEFIRMNLPGSVPNLTMLNTLISNSDAKISEAEFRFDNVRKSSDTVDMQYAFASEDTTGVIPKVNYDSITDTFNGFPIPLNRGVPAQKFYQTDSYTTLKEWFYSIEKSSLLNVHMLQLLPLTDQNVIPSPFLLPAYGTNNRTTANDILHRWWYIFNECAQRNVRIIGFSTGE